MRSLRANDPEPRQRQDAVNATLCGMGAEVWRNDEMWERVAEIAGNSALFLFRSFLFVSAKTLVARELGFLLINSAAHFHHRARWGKLFGAKGTGY